jgi:hypothetical protein
MLDKSLSIKYLQAFSPNRQGGGAGMFFIPKDLRDHGVMPYSRY